MMQYGGYNGRSGANGSGSVGYQDDYLDNLVNNFASPQGNRGYEDPYRRTQNGRADHFSPQTQFSDPFSPGIEDPPYDRRGGPSSYDSRDLDDPYRGRLDESILRNPYIRNNVVKPALGGDRRSAQNLEDFVEPRRTHHYRTDSYNTSVSSLQLGPIYSSAAGARNSVLMPRSPPAIYTLDHLATFTVSQKQRLLTPEDGMHQLRRMENTTGVWTMRVELRIDEREIVVTEIATQKEIECWAISYVHSPVCISSSDKNDVYNNIVIFTVQGDTGRAAEMNVFQCIGVSAQEVVYDIDAARAGKFPRQKKIPPPVIPKKVQPVPEPRPAVIQPVPVEPVFQPPPAVIPQPAQVTPVKPQQPQMNPETQTKSENLNKCIDDIERFVQDVQKAATNNKEYEKKKTEGATQDELNYYKQRSQPPATEEFVLILQKFKYAFNLLPDLKDVLKDPSAAEMVRMLFSPLTMVLNSSRDPDGKLKLAESVTAPLLKLETCRLMDKSLESKDVDLWQSIGESWTIPEERWQGPPVNPYVPEFSGIKPKHQDSPPGSQKGGTFDPQQRFLEELKSRNCSICQAVNTRAASTEKELSITAGEYLEVLKSDKNWWKVSNIRNESGFVPKTIIKVIE